MSNPIGVNYFQSANAAEKERIRAFYGTVLGWERNEINPGLDIFSCSEEITYGVRYLPADQLTLTDAQYSRSTWMSIRADDRDALVARIKEFGVTDLPDHSDENNYFFQAPGGQIYAC